MKKIEFLEKARNIHGYKYNYIDLSDKIILTDKIKLEIDGEIFTQSVSKHLMGKCPEKAVKRKTTDDFISDAKKIWGDKYDYSLVEYTGSLNNVKIIYGGIIYEQRASSHLEGMAPEFRKNEEFLIKEAISKIDSEGKEEIVKFLNKFKIKFKSKLMFNFYLSDIRACIEYRGRHHYEPIDEIGGLKTYELIKNEDRLKEEYCEENFINLIVIKYDQIDDIYQILWDSLSNYIKRKKTS